MQIIWIEKLISHDLLFICGR